VSIVSAVLPNLRSFVTAHKRPAIIGAVASVVLITIAGYSGLAYASAASARNAAQDLQDTLAGLSPLALTQPDAFAALEADALRLSSSTASARRWLVPARALNWIPKLGVRIQDGLLLLEVASSGSKVTLLAAQAYQDAFAQPLTRLPNREVVGAIASSLRGNAASLAAAEQELRILEARSASLRDVGLTGRVRELLSLFLPFADGVLYLSRVSPEVVGEAFVLYREMDTFRGYADDPLGVLEHPSEIQVTLDTVTRESSVVASQMEVVLAALRTQPEEVRGLSSSGLQALEIIIRQVRLLSRVTRGVDGIVAVANLATKSGVLSESFGREAKVELERASQELVVARQEMAAFRAFLSSQDILTEATYNMLLASVLGSPSGSSDFASRLLDEIIAFNQFLYSFLGYDAPHTYLLVGQNENEIRATGGLLGVVVQITIDQGVLTEFTYHDSASVDPRPLTNNPPAPPGLYWYLWMERMLFRDANWNPNFPTAATTMAEIYRRGKGVQADGIITGTKSVMLDLVELFGDITVPGNAGPLDRATAAAYMEASENPNSYPCGPQHTSSRPRRCFDEDLFNAVKERLLGDIPDDLKPKLARTIRDALRRKDVLIHIFQGPASDFVWERGWNGAVLPVSHDFLLVVDSSLPGHSVQDVDRSWEYDVRLQIGGPSSATLNLRWDSRKPPENEVCRQSEEHGAGRCFWNYVRVYASQKASNFVLPPVLLHEGTEKLSWGYIDLDTTSVVRQTGGGLSGLTELGAFVTVEPDSSTTLPLTWELEPSVVRKTGPGVYEYRLLVQKQPGMNNDRVTIAVKLPSGAVPVRLPPDTIQPGSGWVLLNSTLTTDLTFAVSFRISNP
jgi:hypothetical protein